jgi:hypothetical protein
MRSSAGAVMHALALILSSAQAWYRRVPLQSSVQTELTQVYFSMAGTPYSCKFPTFAPGYGVEVGSFFDMHDGTGVFQNNQAH